MIHLKIWMISIQWWLDDDDGDKSANVGQLWWFQFLLWLDGTFTNCVDCHFNEDLLMAKFKISTNNDDLIHMMTLWWQSCNFCPDSSGAKLSEEELRGEGSHHSGRGRAGNLLFCWLVFMMNKSRWNIWKWSWSQKKWLDLNVIEEGVQWYWGDCWAKDIKNTFNRTKQNQLQLNQKVKGKKD